MNPRVPPHDLEAEQATLGAMLTLPSAIPVVLDILSASDFYIQTHQDVFHGIIKVWKRDGQGVDAVTVGDAVPEQRGMIHALTDGALVASNVSHYAEIVKSNAIRRGLVRCGQEIVELGYSHEQETPKAVDQAEAMVHALRPDAGDGGAYAKNVAHSILLDLEQGKEAPRVSTGFTKLDKICGGLYSGNFIVVGARPGVGKTAVALNIAHQVSLTGTVMFFSLEMSKVELMERIMCMVSCVPVVKVRARSIDPDQLANLHKGMGEIEESQLRIVDNPSISMLSLKGKARQYAASRNDLKLIVVDYLQLLRLGTRCNTRHEEVSQISGELKQMARELNVPVMALSQLNRVSTFDENKVDISQLRESGSLEQDADQVWLLSWPKDREFGNRVLNVKVAKNRHGRQDDQTFGWDMDTQRIDF